MNTLATLPAEIVQLIVNQLDDRRDLHTCTLLHPAFNAPANRSLWKTIHLPHHSAGHRFLKCLERVDRSVGHSIHHVHLKDFQWDDNALLVLMCRAPRLVSLVLDDAARITDTSMQHISYCCPGLCSLYLGSSAISHLSFRSLGRLPKLLTLELWECPSLQPDTFSKYFAGAPLERLTLAPFVRDQEEDDFATVDFYNVDNTTIDLTALGSLTHLKLSEAPLGTLHYAHTVSSLCKRSCWPAIMSVDLEGCFGMTDEEAVSLVRALPSGLRHLAIKDGDFTNTTLESIGMYQPHLVELDVSFTSQLTSQGIRRLVRQCSSLSLVKLDYCSISVADFPEAGPQCSGTMVTFDGTSIELKQLDKDAIDRIRHGSDVEDENQK